VTGLGDHRPSYFSKNDGNCFHLWFTDAESVLAIGREMIEVGIRFAAQLPGVVANQVVEHDKSNIETVDGVNESENASGDDATRDDTSGTVAP